ncbi:hypothetical protein [Microbulbifer hydrolyticus]|uniref:hypothetical protein n=1 Tax=Microbulbifer hydrolyticus TaxID=48074 RepID=UPI001F3B3CC5|nr:hypothetical protein [Microbulbifer hydrolyticus]
MEYIAITTSTASWELSEEEFSSDEYQRRLDEYIQKQRELASEYGMNHHWTDSQFIRKSKYGIVKCSKCNDWTMDRVANPCREDNVEAIKDGAFFEGSILCCECLPEGHRWSS